MTIAMNGIINVKKLGHYKPISQIIFFLVSLTILFSCNQKLDVNADWKDITIVYGILDQSDSIQYIKITKAFLGPGDAIQYAKIPDSSNYGENLQVNLEEYSDGSLIRSIPLSDTLVTNKDSGVFYFPVQKIYYTKENLNADNSYQLKIWNKTMGKIIEANTVMVHDFSLELPVFPPGVNLLPGKGSEVKWLSSQGGKRYQLTIRINYYEYPYGSSTPTLHCLDWVPFKDFRSPGTDGGQELSFIIPGNEFYLFLESHLTADPNIQRRLKACDYIFLAGSEDLDSYLELSTVSSTMVQIKPPFSNIVNGIGLFASRHTVSFDSLPFSQITRDSVKSNIHTKNLGF